MFPPNSYIEEKLAKQRMQDHLRRAEQDRTASLAGQARVRRAYNRGPWLRQLTWVGRLLSMLLSGAW